MIAPQSKTPHPVLTYGDENLHTLQQNTFRYFWEETNPENGLIADNTAAAGTPASIAGVGMALASYPVAVERSLRESRARAVERTLTTLRFFWNAPQGPKPDATGHRGFYYHFLDVATGRRAWRCELSTIDTAILLAGALTAAAYFDGRQTTSARCGSSPMRCTDAWTGSGHRTARPRSPMAGSRKAVSCATAGRATTRR